jgi:hypothetical protein
LDLDPVSQKTVKKQLFENGQFLLNVHYRTRTGNRFITAFWYEPIANNIQVRTLLTNEFKLCKGSNFILRSDPDSVHYPLDDPVHLHNNFDEIRLNV